jgi:hypothetical protein
MTENEWQPIETAPFGEVLEVKNDQMDEPCLASRGYVSRGMVNPNFDLFTSIYTPDPFFPTPAGRLVCPKVWRKAPESESHDL